MRKRLFSATPSDTAAHTVPVLGKGDRGFQGYSLAEMQFLYHRDKINLQFTKLGPDRVPQVYGPLCIQDQGRPLSHCGSVMRTSCRSNSLSARSNGARY